MLNWWKGWKFQASIPKAVQTKMDAVTWMKSVSSIVQVWSLVAAAVFAGDGAMSRRWSSVS